MFLLAGLRDWRSVPWGLAGSLIYSTGIHIKARETPKIFLLKSLARGCLARLIRLRFRSRLLNATCMVGRGWPGLGLGAVPALRGSESHPLLGGSTN